MTLRTIIITLACTTVLFASVGGYIYYSSLKSSAMQEAERTCVTNVETVEGNLSSFLTKYIEPVRALAGLEEVRAALRGDSGGLTRANRMLDHFAASFNVDVCYLMDRDGDTIVSSNRGTPKSFVGKNFSFRPYFRRAMAGDPSVYLAKGVVSKKRGVYYSHPVTGADGGTVLGVVVMKVSIEYVESKFFSPYEGIFLVRDPHGIIFMTSRLEWLYRSTHELSPGTREELRESKQFGKGPWPSVGLDLKGERAFGKQGREHLVYHRGIDNFPGWELIYLRSRTAILNSVREPVVRVLGPLVAMLTLIIGVSVYFLYFRASKELYRRKQAEDSLRASERNYRSIYHNTPAMLHSIDSDYRLVSVSDYWLEATGYTREEVIGRKLTDFFTLDSRLYAESVVLPRFFNTGFCKDVPYRFVKKSGEVMDILLSCYGLRNDRGEITGTLAVSVDVTQRKREQEELRQAKEKLSSYSRELERLVNRRTQEISGILKYTPAAISIKNVEGRYRLVNDRFEELFGVTNEEVFGRTDSEALPSDVAEQFSRNDRQVLESETATQYTEWIRQGDGVHTYLAVKFPIYGEDGTVNGVCGIATDITELQRAQDKLRNLSRHIISNQEKEREAISRELHDELGQTLTALRMDCAWLESHLRDAGDKGLERASIMRELIDKTIDDVSRMAFQLRPGILDDLGLVDAVESLIRDYERRTDIDYVFDGADVPELERTKATAVYRIIQEGITNAVRHSGANQIIVDMRTENGYLRVDVRDNGRGMREGGAGQTGFGIPGMQERADIVGGELRMHSRPGKGTTLRCRIPMDDKR
jgi:PAS domain S-box-containing protein